MPLAASTRQEVSWPEATAFPLRFAPFALFLAFFLAAPPACGQSYSDPGTGYGAELGYARGNGAESGGATGGVHTRLRLTGGLDLEISAGYRRDAFEDGGARVLTVDQIPLAVSFLVFALHDGRVQPYVLAGAGYTWAKPRGVGTNAATSYKTENLFALHAGAGVEARTSFRTSVFLDARYVFLDIDAVRALPAQPKADHVRVAAGFNVYF